MDDKAQELMRMGKATTIKRQYGKDVFMTGEYIDHFAPDDKWNPFSEIYRQKKLDTVNIIDTLHNSMTILDAGGGMGRLALELSQSLKKKVFLMDISVDMLKMARKHADSTGTMEVVNADAHDLPFPDNSFDIIVGLDLMCHLAEPERALREFHRVLTNTGTLILDSTNSNPLWAVFYPRYMGKNPLQWLKIMKFNGILPGWENIVKHYPRKKFFSLLHNGGFDIVQELNYGPSVCPKWHLAVSVKI